MAVDSRARLVASTASIALCAWLASEALACRRAKPAPSAAKLAAPPSGQASSSSAPAAAADLANARALAEYKAQQDAEGGPIDWQQLAAFFPARLGPFAASDEARGRNQAVGGGFEVSMAARNYKSGNATMRVAIGDKHLNPMALISLERGKEFERTNSDGFTRVTKLGGYPELLSWQARRAQSLCAVLLGPRLLEVAVLGAAAPDQAEAMAKQLALDAIARLRAAGGAGLQPRAGSTRPPP